MKNEPLMDVVVQTVLFLELSDTQAVADDAAVAMMEQIAATLQCLEPAEKEHFLQYIDCCALNATTNAERDVLKNMASSLGLKSIQT